MSLYNMSKLHTEINLSKSILDTLQLDIADNDAITLTLTNQNDLKRLKESLCSMQDLTLALSESYNRIKQLIN